VVYWRIPTWTCRSHREANVRLAISLCTTRRLAWPRCGSGVCPKEEDEILNSMYRRRMNSVNQLKDLVYDVLILCAIVYYMCISRSGLRLRSSKNLLVHSIHRTLYSSHLKQLHSMSGYLQSKLAVRIVVRASDNLQKSPSSRSSPRFQSLDNLFEQVELLSNNCSQQAWLLLRYRELDFHLQESVCVFAGRFDVSSSLLVVSSFRRIPGSSLVFVETVLQDQSSIEVILAAVEAVIQSLLLASQPDDNLFTEANVFSSVKVTLGFPDSTFKQHKLVQQWR
jgi:hypothetical protein